MQPTLNHIATFCQQKRISINADKTKELIFKRTRYTENKTPLTFQGKATRATKLKSLYNQKYGPCQSTMMRLFKIFIRPLFEYGHTATITISKKNLETWESIQSQFSVWFKVRRRCNPILATSNR